MCRCAMRWVEGVQAGGGQDITTPTAIVEGMRLKRLSLLSLRAIVISIKPLGPERISACVILERDIQSSLPSQYKDSRPSLPDGVDSIMSHPNEVRHGLSSSCRWFYEGTPWCTILSFLILIWSFAPNIHTLFTYMCLYAYATKHPS